MLMLSHLIDQLNPFKDRIKHYKDAATGKVSLLINMKLLILIALM